MKSLLLVTFGLMAAPALAQSAEDAQAQAIVLPMIQSNVQGLPDASPEVVQILAACVVAIASPEEKAALAAASGPSQELADQIVNPILSRPEMASCVQASAG